MSSDRSQIVASPEQARATLFVGALPLQPGTAGDIDRWVSDMTQTQHAEYDRLMRAAGARDASYWRIPTPAGEMVAVVYAVDDVQQFFATWEAERGPFIEWWTGQMRHFHGDPGDDEGIGQQFFHWSA
jgi:hypothetical protein